MKTVSFRPQRPATAEDWVSGGQSEDRPRPNAAAAGPLKRLSIDLPPALHTRIKVECARRGIKMGDAIRELFEQHFPKG